MSNRSQQRGPSVQTPKHKRDRRHTPSAFHILSDNMDNLNSLIKDRFWELGQATKILVDQIQDLQAQLTTEKHGFNVLLSLITSLGKVTTNSVDEHAPPQRKNSNASVNPLHTNLRVGLKRSRAQLNDSSKESKPCIRGDTFDGYTVSIRKRRRLSALQSSSSFGSRSCSANSRLPNDLPGSSRSIAQPSPIHSLHSIPLTTYPNALDDANGWLAEDSQLFVRPRSPNFMQKKRYFFEEYDREKQHWIFIRDRRLTDAGKRQAADLLEEGYRDCGTFQADLEDCARMTDTTFEFKAWAEYFDVPYSGDKNVLTPNDPGYPSRLRTKPPPPPSSSSERSDESWHGIQGLAGYDL